MTRRVVLAAALLVMTASMALMATSAGALTRSSGRLAAAVAGRAGEPKGSADEPKGSAGAGQGPVGSAGRLGARHGSGANGRFWVGAAELSITPKDLAGVYLGGYGIGPVHPAKGVLRPIFVQVMAVRGSSGGQVIVGVIDVQGEFLAYQQGPYGFATMAAWAQQHLGVPADHVLLQSVHTHNGPDDIGVWGGVPTSYLAFVAKQTEAAMRRAVADEVPARLRWAQVALPGFTRTFGTGPDGDQAAFPTDDTLVALQAIARDGRVVATLVNFSAHPTVYGPLDEVSPDWPGATATYLQDDQRHLPAGVHTGYPGSVAIVTVGAVGHTWPAATLPAGAEPTAMPTSTGDRNAPADRYGDAVAHAAMVALAHARPVGPGVVGGVSQPVSVVATNPALLGLLYLDVPGYHLDRSLAPAYITGNVVHTVVTSVRIGDLLFTGAPGEEYPSIQQRLAASVSAAAVVPFSLAMDQLGYIAGPQGYAAAQVCSPTDEGLFMLSPVFGTQLARTDDVNARRLGFTVRGQDLVAGAPSAATVAGLAGCAASQVP
jgi:hypothetical protein